MSPRLDVISTTTDNNNNSLLDASSSSNDFDVSSRSEDTGFTRQTSVSSTLRSKRALPSPTTTKRRPTSKTTLRLKAFQPNVNVPPLDFGLAGLVGRQEELSTLQSCLSSRKKELILVGGWKWRKSSLIRSLEQEISPVGLFVQGKFDRNTSNKPYSVGSIDRVDETKGGVDRLRFAFRVLTRVFSAVFSPLVLFLDDLQWSDVSSLQVMEYLISDTQNENPLMIIGSYIYRSEEVDENSLLRNKMVALRGKSEKFHFHMTELTIEAFSPSDIEKVITAVLPSLRADHIVGLAALCHKRTLGNPFFTIEFLKMLHLEGMLQFDKTTQTWSWNLGEIRKETMSTANVVGMLEQQLRKLPEQVQALLQCAAILGSTFSEPTIELVWSVYGRRLVDTRTKPVSTLLELLVAEKVFEKVGENNNDKDYRWCHDKLQEAALSLSGALRETFQLDIGKTLYYGLTQEQAEEDLFIIVDLINNGNTLKRPEFAAVNLRAATKAREISALQNAAEGRYQIGVL